MKYGKYSHSRTNSIQTDCYYLIHFRLAEEKRAKEHLNQDYSAALTKHQEKVQQFQQEKMKLIGDIKEHQQKIRQSEQLREAVEMGVIRERVEWTQKYELVQRELLNRLENSEEAHQRSVHELREVMAAQHKIGVK